jgi:hypothetical protein
MTSRINFLIAAGLLILMALFLAGYYLFATPIAAVAPSWAPYVMGVWVLVSLGLVVSILARLHGALAARFAGARRGPQRPLGFAGQALLYMGHIVLIAGAFGWLRGETGIQPAVAGATLLIYIGGIAATLTDWRRSAM